MLSARTFCTLMNEFSSDACDERGRETLWGAETRPNCNSLLTLALRAGDPGARSLAEAKPSGRSWSTLMLPVRQLVHTLGRERPTHHPRAAKGMSVKLI